jgi:hypothetical protein
MQLLKAGRTVALLTRNGHDYSTRLPTIASYVARLLENGAPTATRLLNIYPPSLREHSRLDAVRARSRARYQRPRELVESRIRRFIAPRLRRASRA